jgi:predicted phosphoribosyltransferase
MERGREVVVYEPRPIFQDRHDAGKRLANRLTPFASEDAIVLAIPCGGVPVAIEVAIQLGTDLDVIIPRKIPIPGNPEAGYGAVTDDGGIVLNEPLVANLGLTQREIRQQAEEVRAEIDRRHALYRGQLPYPVLQSRTVIVVDDGLASGFTMVAAVESLRRKKAGKVVVAVPVASASAFERVNGLADDLVALVVAHSSWFAVASFYHHWYDLPADEVIKYLGEWRRQRG